MNESMVTMLSVLLVAMAVIAELNLLRIFLRDGWREGDQQVGGR